MNLIKPISITLCYWIMSLSLVAQAPRIVINPQGHSGKIHNLVFTPDGNRLISISEDKTIRIWNANTGEPLKKFESEIGDGYEGMLYSSALSPDGKLLAVGGYMVSGQKENYVIIIDIEKGEQVATAIGHSNSINSLAFSSSGVYLASGSEDGTVIIWKMEKTPKLTVATTIEVGFPVYSISFNKKSQELAVGGESSDVLIYPTNDLKKGLALLKPKVLRKHKGIINKIIYSPEGSYLASCSHNNELIIWSAGGTMVKEIERLKDGINTMAFSFDGKILAALDFTGKGMSLSIPSGNKLTDFVGHDNAAFSSVFSPSFTSNYTVASAGGINNEIILWNPINGLTIRKIKGKGNAIFSLAFGEGYELFISNKYSGKEKSSYQSSFDFSSFTLKHNPVNAPIESPLPKDIFLTSYTSIALPKGKTIQTDESADGRILNFRPLKDGSVVVASDFSLKLFDKNGFLLKEFIGHTGAVRSVTVSTDGKYLASGGDDESIIIWKLSETGFAPSLRSYFDTPEWTEYFTSLPVDSLTNQTSKQAWLDVIAFLKQNSQKTYKEIESAYKSLGEILIPFATLFVADDGEWVCWTPKGYFTCSSSGAQYFGWHTNRGIEKLADFYEADQFFEILYHPKEMAKSIIDSKRIEEIIKESGARVFDLGKLDRPSAAFFENYVSVDTADVMHYVKGELVTKTQVIPANIEIYDGGGGVKEVSIYHNDKLIIRDTTITSKGEGDIVMKKYNLELTNGENQFKVKVRNFYKVESRADVFNINYIGNVIASSSLYVMSVGINKYLNSSYELNYAQPDAKAFVDKLQEHNQGIYKAIYTTEIYDAKATKANMVKEFNNIIAKAKPQDVFVFFYAGHGTINEDKDNAFYLVPTDVTKLYGDASQLEKKALSYEELKNLLTQVKAQKQIVLMDACHSGAVVASMGTVVASMKVRSAGSDEKAIMTLARSSGVHWMASSGTKQFATEFEVLKHGTFTYALLEAMDGKADRGDGQVSISEVRLYMDERVPELTEQYGGSAQFPTFYLTGNDFPLTVPKKK